MRKLKYALPLVIFAGALVSSSTLSFGKAEYTKKEKKGCVFCHVKANSKELNDAGKYYEKKKTLDGDQAAEKKAE
ncbi:MAG: hypothetical protein HY822_21945 [Acidobacteria bacterium]|nr:hypothetical protein [Acidobacteriota bacterium]